MEEQFYLAAPLMIRHLSRRMLIRLLLGLMVAAPVLRILLTQMGNPVSMSHLTPARADALSAGVLLAIVWRSPRARMWAANHVKALRAAWVVLFALSILLFEVRPPSY